LAGEYSYEFCPRIVQVDLRSEYRAILSTFTNLQSTAKLEIINCKVRSVDKYCHMGVELDPVFELLEGIAGHNGRRSDFYTGL
jgi:hypothetical protein